MASESLNRPNSAMNRGKGPKVAEPRRHRDSLAPLELPPDDAGVPPQVRPRPETVSTLPFKGTTSDLKMRQLRRNQTGRHLSELRHGVGILAALNAAGTESHDLPAIVTSPSPASSSPPSTTHLTPHLIDDSNTEMASTFTLIEHQGDIVELDLCLLATLRSRPAVKKRYQLRTCLVKGWTRL